MTVAELLNGLVRMMPGAAEQSPPPIPFDAFVPYRTPADPELGELEEALESLESQRGL